MDLRFSSFFSAMLFMLVASAQIPAFQPGVLEVEMRVNGDANEVISGGASSPVTPFQQIKLKYGVTYFQESFPEFENLKRFYTLRFTQINKTEALIEDLKKLNEVVGVAKISLATMEMGAIPIDAEGDNMWFLKKINVAGWDHWKEMAGNGRIIKIAVVDNGVRLNHEDLRDIIYRNPNEIPNDGVDNDNNGYIDDYMGYDVADKDPNANPPLHRVTTSFFSHGTMVAGLSSASTDNGKGIASLGLNTRIIPVKCVYDTATSDADFRTAWDGIRYAIAAGAHIINLSWSQGTLTPGQQGVLDEALGMGIIIVAASGNYGNQDVMYPAAYEGVIAVGATTSTDQVWSNSNFGTYIDVMAPGENIYTTTAKSDNSYGFGSGTSFSTPIVSGFIGLLLSQENDPQKVVSILKKGCDDIDIENPTKVGLMGAGRINIDKTLNILINGDPEGLIDFNANREILVYPNPSQGIVRVAAETVIEELVVIDLSGKEVAHLTVNGNTADLTACQLKGLHIIQVKNQEGVFTARVYFQ
ncbi:MAG: S8 family peptidase [Bacteroidia bacterium]